MGFLLCPFHGRDAPPALANASNQAPTLLYPYQGLLAVVLLCREMFDLFRSVTAVLMLIVPRESQIASIRSGHSKGYFSKSAAGNQLSRRTFGVVGADSQAQRRGVRHTMTSSRSPSIRPQFPSPSASGGQPITINGMPRKSTHARKKQGHGPLPRDLSLQLR